MDGRKSPSVVLADGCSGEPTGDIDDEMAATLAVHVECRDTRQQDDRLAGACLAGLIDVEVAGVGTILTDRDMPSRNRCQSRLP